jgi:hypothetical protein
MLTMRNSTMVHTQIITTHIQLDGQLDRPINAVSRPSGLPYHKPRKTMYLWGCEGEYLDSNAVCEVVIECFTTHPLSDR